MYKLTYKTKPRREMLTPNQAKIVDRAGWTPCFRMLVLTEAQADWLRKEIDPNLAVVIHQLIAPLEYTLADIEIKKVTAVMPVGAKA